MKVDKEEQLIKPKGLGMTQEQFSKAIRLPANDVKQKVENICTLWETGKYTLETCCHQEGVPLSVLKHWVRDDLDLEMYMLKGIEPPAYCYPDLHKRFKDAAAISGKNYMDSLKQEAREALGRKVRGFASKEVSQKLAPDSRLEIQGPDGKMIPNPNFGKLMVTEKRIKIKEETPDTAAIIFALTNSDKEHFKNRNFVHTDPAAFEADDLSKLSDEELQAKIIELENTADKFKQ